MTHRWAEPTREPWATYRQCRRCGMLRVTRHDDAASYPWVEFMQGGVLLEDRRTPKCEPVEAKVDA